jgi:Mg-chelatase subunit ChlD
MIRLVTWFIVAMLSFGAFLPSLGVHAQDDDATDAEATIAALQTQVASLQAEQATAPAKQTPTPEVKAVTEGDTVAEASASVNVELILDVSGSMAAGLDTGETRMDAAKRVLSGVVAAIPERKGVSVGLRIYGHEGDNTEAGKSVSCKASELVVPVKGVDKGELNDEIEALQPTGWTPIALSLERARKDFPDASDTVTNAIVLVTDGLETCGGDPAKAAAKLRGGDTKTSTNVIGFALTAEEQQTLASIAKQGKGQLLSANNADELSAALFSVLEKLKIVTGTGYVGGNAFSLLGPGEAGEVSVIATGSFEAMVGDSIPFVVRNNTTEDVANVKVTGTIRDADGRVIGAANGLLMTPTYVTTGGVSFGQAYFGDIDMPADATVEFKAEATPVSELRFNNFRDLDVVEASLFENRVTGTLENTHNEAVKGTIAIQTLCFDLEGNVLSLAFGSVDTSRIEAGDSTPFQVTLFYGSSGQGCPAFLVAGYGYKA